MNVWLQFGTVLSFPQYVPVIPSPRTEATFSTQHVHINLLYVLMLWVEGSYASSRHGNGMQSQLPAFTVNM